MEQTMPAHAEASARVLAMVVAANGRVDERELRSLDELDAFSRLGVSRERFVELARTCVCDVGTQLCECSWLRADHMAYIDALLDAVPDAGSRALVCRLAAAVIAADGRVTHDERLVYDHALARWRVSPASVMQAILHDRVR